MIFPFKKKWGSVSAQYIQGQACACVHGLESNTVETVRLPTGSSAMCTRCYFTMPIVKHAVLHPLIFFSPFPHRLVYLTHASLSLSFFVSAPLLIPLSFNCPTGSRERSLHKVKAGTSLPVYIKNLSFSATGSAVRDKERNIQNRNWETDRDKKKVTLRD